MLKFVLVTESGGDVPAEWARRYGIRIVPMHVQFGDATYDDGSIPTSNVFRHYESTGQLPRTSGCTPQDFIPLFDAIHEENPEAHILHLAYSAVTTCSFESSRIAAEGRDYVTAIDTKSVTAAQALIVTNTAAYLEANPDATLAEVEEFAASQIDRARMAFIPGGLEFLRAGGRLSNGAYLGAQLLRIKPVIEILDGKLVATKKLRGSMEKAAEKLVDDLLNREPMDKERIAFIRNEGLSEDVRRMAEEKARAAGYREITWIETGSVIASHCGPGSFGIAAFAAE